MFRKDLSDPELLSLQFKLHALRHESLLLERDHLVDLSLRRKGSLASESHEHIFNRNQPRVPAGTPEGGQWASSGWHDAARIARQREALDGRDLVEPAFAGPMARYAIQKTFELGVALYGLWSQQNGPDRRTVLKFRAQEYSADGEGTLELEGVQSLTRDEVAQSCRRFGQVQDMVNETTRRLKDENPDLSAPVLGTKIHKEIESQINGLHEGDFAAERSRIKGRNESYGVAGTVRIDALELSTANTVCVYDIKTGRSRLSFGRMLELGTEAQTAFGEGPKRIIVVEVTPSS